MAPVYKFHVLLDADRLIMAGSPSATDAGFVAIKTRFPTALLVSLTHDLPTFRLGYVLSADGETATRPPLSYLPPPDRHRAVLVWAAREYRALHLEQMLRSSLVAVDRTDLVTEADHETVQGFAHLMVNTLAAASVQANVISRTTWPKIQATLQRTAAAHVAWADGLQQASVAVYASAVRGLEMGAFYSWHASSSTLVRDSTVSLTSAQIARAKKDLSR